MCVAELALLATVVSAAGSIQQGKSEAAAYKAQAAANDQNAKIAEKQAEDSSIRGAKEERLMRMRTKQEIGSGKAMFAANNLDISSGSPLDILDSTAFNGEMDALTVRRNTSFDVWGLQNEAVNQRNQARANRSAAHNAKVAGYMSAAGTLLTGGSNYKSAKTKTP